MATKASSQEKKTKKKVQGKRLDVQAVAMIDNIIFTKTDMWAYFKLPNAPFDFLSMDQKWQEGVKITNGIGAVMSERQTPLDGHMIVTNFPMDVDAWYSQVEAKSKAWDKAPGYQRFIEEDRAYLEYNNFLVKKVYFGLHLGKRGEVNLDASSMLEAGVEGALDQLKRWGESLLKPPAEEISAKEEEAAHRKEKLFYDTLHTGNLRAERATSEELLLLLKRELYPAMTVPYLDIDVENRVGPGDIDLEMASVIRNRMRWLEIEQVIDGRVEKGYRAALTIAKTERETNFPYDGMIPLFYLIDREHFDYTCYARFTLLPSTKMKKELDKKKAETQDGITNWEASDTTDKRMGLPPAELSDAIEDMETISDDLNDGGKTPWVQGTYRIVVTEDTEEHLKEVCNHLKQQYANMGVVLSWSAGDQANILLEQMPGDKVRSKSYVQTTNLAFLGTLGATFSSTVGDAVKNAN